MLYMENVVNILFDTYTASDTQDFREEGDFVRGLDFNA